MARPHQPGEAVFRSILPEDIDWKPFPAFPPAVRLAVIVGHPSEPGPYLIRVKAPGGTKLMPHRHPEDRVYTVVSGVFYIGLGEEFDGDKGGYRFNGWRLDRRGRKLVDAKETPIPLSKGEYALLLAFLEAPQRPLSREHLLQATRIHEDIFDRSIDVQVLRLRRKLEIEPSTPRVIQTERGIGYAFMLPVEPF